VTVVDIIGAYLNADMSPITVHMRVDPFMTSLLTKLKPSYGPYVRRDGDSIVKLEKALYGCVESAALWADHIKATLIADDFVQNFVEPCCYNRQFVKASLEDVEYFHHTLQSYYISVSVLDQKF
jgi:hypothetical protein